MKALVIFSGGLDSTICLAKAIEDFTHINILLKDSLLEMGSAQQVKISLNTVRCSSIFSFLGIRLE